MSATRRDGPSPAMNSETAPVPSSRRSSEVNEAASSLSVRLLDGLDRALCIDRWTSGADGSFGICLFCGKVGRELAVEHGCRSNLSDDELQQVRRVAIAKRNGLDVLTRWRS